MYRDKPILVGKQQKETPGLELDRPHHLQAETPVLAGKRQCFSFPLIGFELGGLVVGGVVVGGGFLISPLPEPGSQIPNQSKAPVRSCLNVG